MNFFVFALLVAGASAQWVTPYNHWGVHHVAPAVHSWSPYYTGLPLVNHDLLKKEWDQKDGSLKSIKIDEEKLKEYHLRSLYPLALPYSVKVDEKKEEKRSKRNVVADFAYSSLDANRDGQPDNKQIFPYAAYPYHHPYTYAAYPYSHLW